MTMTPVMKPNTVEMVSVEWIMQNATGSVDGYGNDGGPGTVDYESMVYGKATDSHFGILVWNILNLGFRVPIVLDIGYDGPDTITHGNGHHRMCAAILLCISEIPVYWSDGDYMSSRVSDSQELDYSNEAKAWDDLAEFLSEEFYNH